MEKAEVRGARRTQERNIRAFNKILSELFFKKKSEFSVLQGLASYTHT